jgi:hypothetical protein
MSQTDTPPPAPEEPPRPEQFVPVYQPELGHHQAAGGWLKRRLAKVAKTINEYSATVIAVATIVNVLISAYLYDATRRGAEVAQRAYDAGSRPYVGVDKAEHRADTSGGHGWVATVRNFGTSPADSLIVSARLSVHGSAVAESQTGPLLLIPSRDVVIRGAIGSGEHVTDILAGSGGPLELTVFGTYRGPSGSRYIIDENYVWFPDLQAFVRSTRQGPF